MKGFLSLLVLSLGLAGCGNPLTAPAQPTLGGISVQVEPVGARGVSSVSIAQAEAASDWYEVIAYNVDHTYYVSSGKGTPGVNPYASGVTIDNMVAGTYKVIVLAGRNTDVATKDTVLLGTGVAGVTVGLGVTPVSISLTNILWDIWTWSTTIGVNTNFGATYRYDSGLGLIIPRSTNGIEYTWRSREVSTGALGNVNPVTWGIVWDQNAYSGLGAYKSEHSLAGLAASGSYRFSLKSPVLVLDDPVLGYTKADLAAVTGTTWKMPNDDHGSFKALTGTIDAETLSASFSAPAIGPTVTWGAGR